MATPFPWVFPYVEEPRPQHSPFRDRPLMRPAVPIGIVGPSGPVGVAALVDSGADHVPRPRRFTTVWTAMNTMYNGDALVGQVTEGGQGDDAATPAEMETATVRM